MSKLTIDEWFNHPVRVFGDIHGNIDRYIADHKEFKGDTLQIGDFGYGFDNDFDFLANKWFEDNRQARFIRGNHDSYQACKKSVGFIDDGTFENEIMFIGGAWSIDWKYRVPGVSWWEDEQIDDNRFDQILHDILDIRPKVIISHEGPNQFIQPAMFDSGRISGQIYYNKTAAYLTSIFEQHQPKLWIMGHWHFNVNMTINGTEFQCIGANEYLDIDLKQYIR